MKRENKAKQKVEKKVTEQELAQAENEQAKIRVEHAIERKRERELKKKEQAKKCERAEQKKQEKADRRQRRGKAASGWIASVVTLGSICLILATLLTVSLMGKRPKKTQALEYVYESEFSDLAEYVDNIDINLSKALVTNDERQMQKLLVKISEQSALAEFDLQSLPLDYQNKLGTAKVINQVGDYANYLNNRLIDGDTLSEKDYEQLEMLYGRNAELKQSLENINREIQTGARLSDLFKNEKSVGTKSFSDLESMSVNYPQLIYDGPFSDGVADKDIKGLPEKEVSEEKAQAFFKSYFKDYNLSGWKLQGESSGDIPCYNFTAHDDMGVELYAQISKRGGKLILFNYAKKCEQGEKTDEECVLSGQKFLKSLGIEGMKAVWIEANGKMLTINYAYEQNGVIIYPDLIKLNVCRDKAQVFGMEAKSYYFNHADRFLAQPSLTESQAKARVSVGIKVESVRLTLIPKGNDKEVLAYEIEGAKDGATYFIYVNAANGAEEQIFKVIETDNGKLLI